MHLLKYKLNNINKMEYKLQIQKLMFQIEFKCSKHLDFSIQYHIFT